MEGKRDIFADSSKKKNENYFISPPHLKESQSSTSTVVRNPVLQARNHNIQTEIIAESSQSFAAETDNNYYQVTIEEIDENTELTMNKSKHQPAKKRKKKKAAHHKSSF